MADKKKPKIVPLHPDLVIEKEPPRKELPTSVSGVQGGVAGVPGAFPTLLDTPTLPEEAPKDPPAKVVILSQDRRRALEAVAKRRMAAERRAVLLGRLNAAGRALLALAGKQGVVALVQVDPEERQSFQVGLAEWTADEKDEAEEVLEVLVEAKGLHLGEVMERALALYQDLDAEE